MKLKGTEFQIEVWKELSKIPKGEVRTYKQIAKSIGKPKSSRAVANACAKNPYPIVIPCHRVIRSDGTVGGYSGHGGIKRKKELLQKEGLKFYDISGHGRIRTCDTRFRKPVLYPLSYAAIKNRLNYYFINNSIRKDKVVCSRSKKPKKNI